MGIKEKLLATGAFIESDSLFNYLDLIQNNINTKYEKYKTDKHHIIPQEYFIYNNEEIDNSQENIVYLSHIDHIKAHIYLYQCSIGIHHAKLACSVKLMLARFNLNIEQFLNIIDYSSYEQMLIDANVYVSKKLKGHKLFGAGTTDKIAVYKNDKQKFINTSDLDLFLADNWQIGSISSGTKNFKWMNNGIEQKFINPDQQITYLNDGWTFGRIQSKPEKRIGIYKDNIQKYVYQSELQSYLLNGWEKGSKPDSVVKINRDTIRNKNKNSNWLTNGIESIFIEKQYQNKYLNKGYYYGRASRTKKKND